jgi:hypothetical protein
MMSKSVTKATEQSTLDEYDCLIKLLEEEILVYDQILESLNIKQHSIVENNLDQMRECIQAEHPLIKSAQKNAETLMRSLEKLKDKNQKNAANTTLKEIIKTAPKNHRGMLENLRRRLQVCLKQIARLNNENSYLLNFSLEFTKGMIQRFLKSDDEDEFLYNVKGHISASDKHNKIVNVRI